MRVRCMPRSRQRHRDVGAPSKKNASPVWHASNCRPLSPGDGQDVAAGAQHSARVHINKLPRHGGDILAHKVAEVASTCTSSTQLDWVCLSQHRLSIVLHQHGSPMQWVATEQTCLLLMPQLVSCCGSPAISEAAPSLRHIPGGICPASTRMRGARDIRRHEPHQ